MVTAIVLMNVERERVNEVAERLAELPSVSEVYSVGGRYDLIAIIRVKETEALADTVTRDMVAIPGIRHTETMLAFRAFSRHDLDAVFSIGFQE